MRPFPYHWYGSAGSHSGELWYRTKCGTIVQIVGRSRAGNYPAAILVNNLDVTMIGR